MGLLKKTKKEEVKPQEVETTKADIGDAPQEVIDGKESTLSVGTLNHNEAWLMQEIQKCYSGIETLIIEMQELKKWLREQI